MAKTVLQYSLALILITIAPIISSAQNADSKDSVTVTGKFVSPCYIPEKIKIYKFNVWESLNEASDIPVDRNGEFVYRIAMRGLQQYTLSANQIRLDFMVTPEEKTYNFEVTCIGSGKIELKNSYENNAFTQLYNLNRTLTDSLVKISKLNFSIKDTFQLVRNLFLDYQRNVSSIAAAYPRSYTAKVLCPGEMLPETTFSSPQAFRDNFLKREVISDRQYYYCNFFSYWVLTDYTLFLNKKDGTFTGYGQALDIAYKNPETAKIIELLIYNNVYFQNREPLVKAYIDWAKQFPDKILNLPIKAQLKNIESCLSGNTYSDLLLTDPNGVPKKLSETIASSKLTLLIFYSPTCAHCRETLPKIVPIANKFKSKGFSVYAVGFEGTNEEWNDFIKTKGTGDWINVFTHDNNVVFGSKYRVNNTPTLILINQQGVIIRRLADFDYLKEEIPKYFAQ